MLKEDGLFVKLQRPFGKLLAVVPVHKGSCDETLEARCRSVGVDTNVSIEIDFFEDDEQRENYILTGEIAMTNDEFFHKYYNDNGTLKNPNQYQS